MSDKVLLTEEKFRLALAIAALEAPAKEAGLDAQWSTLLAAQDALAGWWGDAQMWRKAWDLIYEASSLSPEMKKKYERFQAEWREEIARQHGGRR